MELIFEKTSGLSLKWLALQLVCVITLFASCGEQEKQKREEKLNDFNAYVQRHQDSVDYYAQRNWDELNAEYEQKRAEFDKDLEKMDEQAKERYNKTVSDWETFKGNYQQKSNETAAVQQMDKLRATLAIDGVRPDYTDLTAADIVREYEHFVNTVEANKDAYTKEQWTVINVNYKALNGRKRELEKEIKSVDMPKITKQQLRYTGIKATNRPFAEEANS